MMEHYHSIKPLECTVVGPGVVVKVEEEETYNPHNAQNCGTDSVCVSTKREVKTEWSEEMAGRRKLKAEDRQLFQENNIGCVKLKPEVIIKEEDDREAPLMNKEEMCADGQSLDVAAEHKMNCDVKVKIEEDDQSYVMADHPFEERDSSPAASPDYFLVQVKEEEEDLAFGMDYQQQGEAVVCPQTSSGREKDGRMQRMPSKMFINIAQLIQMVQMRPEIYDPKVPSYADRYKKKKAWDEICAVVVPDWDMYGEKEKNIRVEEIKGKWRSLKDTFKKEVEKERRSQTNGRAAYTSHYKHYHLLLFMKPIFLGASTRDSLPETNVDPSRGPNQKKQVKAKDRLQFSSSATRSSTVTPSAITASASRLPTYQRRPKKLARRVVTDVKTDNKTMRQLMNAMIENQERAKKIEEDEAMQMAKSLVPHIRQVHIALRANMHYELLGVAQNFVRQSLQLSNSPSLQPSTFSHQSHSMQASSDFSHFSNQNSPLYQTTNQPFSCHNYPPHNVPSFSQFHNPPDTNVPSATTQSTEPLILQLPPTPDEDI